MREEVLFHGPDAGSLGRGRGGQWWRFGGSEVFGRVNLSVARPISKRDDRYLQRPY